VAGVGGICFSALEGGAIMKRTLFWAGALVLGLAALMWATAPISGQHGGGGHGGGGGHAGGGHPAASVGSVHAAGREAPVHVAPAPVGPVVRAGAVRSEHYAGSTLGGGHRNPYGEEYSRHFRPGYNSFLIGDASYYYYASMPPGYEQVVLDGITYYLLDGVYYQPYIYGGQTVYLVVPTQ
jgi:hypothetical protein